MLFRSTEWPARTDAVAEDDIRTTVDSLCQDDALLAEDYINHLPN